MSHNISGGIAALRAKLAAVCPEREIFLRSGGKIKFIRLSRRIQVIGAATCSAAVLGWAALTFFMALGGLGLTADPATAAGARETTQKTTGDRNAMEALARDLKARQDFMDDLYRTHFGDGEEDSKDAAPASDKQAQGGAPELKAQISAVTDANPLSQIDQRQRRFAALMTRAVERRADRTAAAIRSLGLNPDKLVRAASRAQGGPFVPWPGDKEAMPGEFEKLADALSRMELLEASLTTIPSGLPTTAPMQSSSYGYRRDPFTGHAAFHAGIDFPGHRGQAILAAAAGKVSFVGQRSGYGNVVEVNHGNGLMTRYAHLSGFNTRVGQRVNQGDQIARMGSTGRSTGDHLHFEVRRGGEAINPRRFLEATKDVLQVQQVATARIAEARNRS